MLLKVYQPASSRSGSSSSSGRFIGEQQTPTAVERLDNRSGSRSSRTTATTTTTTAAATESHNIAISNVLVLIEQ